MGSRHIGITGASLPTATPAPNDGEGCGRQQDSRPITRGQNAWTAANRRVPQVPVEDKPARSSERHSPRWSQVRPHTRPSSTSVSAPAPCRSRTVGTSRVVACDSVPKWSAAAMCHRVAWAAAERVRRTWCRLSAICQQFVRERDEIGGNQTSRVEISQQRKVALNRANRHQPTVHQTARAGVQVPPPTLGLWVAGSYNPQNACRSGVPKSGAADTFTGRTCPPSNTSRLTSSLGSS
jgi:hypothetical protein